MPNFIINVKEKGAKKAEKNVKGLNKALGGLKSQAMLASGAFLGAGALVAGIKKAVDAFGEQELAEKKLEASLGRTSQALLDQAAALQQVSVFGDETIISAQALIGAFVKDEDQIKLATEATLDLAAAKGMDLVAAAELVSKTLGSSTNALSRYGIEVTGAVGSTERLESLTGNLATVFGGQASAQAETMSGSLQQMSNAVGDAAEAIGGLLSPVVIGIADTLKFFAEGTEAVIDALNFDQELPELVGMLTDVEVKTAEFKKTLNGLTSEELMKLVKSINEQVAPTLTLWSDESELILQKQIALREELAKNPEKIQAAERRTAAEIHLRDLKKVEVLEVSTHVARQKRKEEQIKKDLKGALLSGQSASQAMKSVVRAEVMEATAGYFSSIFKTVPFPLYIGLAAGAGVFVSGVADKVLGEIPSFATGGDFVTNGSQMIMVGDNPSGKERVQVTPLDAGGDPTGGGGSVNITFNSPIMSADHTEEVIIPQIREALRRGSDLGIS